MNNDFDDSQIGESYYTKGKMAHVVPFYTKVGAKSFNNIFSNLSYIQRMHFFILIISILIHITWSQESCQISVGYFFLSYAILPPFPLSHHHDKVWDVFCFWKSYPCYMCSCNWLNQINQETLIGIAAITSPLW